MVHDRPAFVDLTRDRQVVLSPHETVPSAQALFNELKSTEKGLKVLRAAPDDEGVEVEAGPLDMVDLSASKSPDPTATINKMIANLRKFM